MKVFSVRRSQETGSDLMRPSLQKRRPKAAIGYHIPMLRSQPALPPFAALAKSVDGRADTPRDVASINATAAIRSARVRA